mmetsp:Transcript_263/g.463  ORF Transcript_263/g.463 Transcript_263/m.463 type:complete len:297 (-) Transcript_263:1170-2060(-)
MGVSKKVTQESKPKTHFHSKPVKSTMKSTSSLTNFRGGLRELSCQVAHEISIRKETNYEQVADSLVQQILQMKYPNASNSSIKLSHSNDKNEKEIDDMIRNSRRRVYDIINVLEAIGMLEKKSKKMIVWKGKCGKDEITEMEMRLKEKQSVIGNLKKRKAILEKIMEHNKKRVWEFEEKVELPMVVVDVGVENGKVEVEMDGGKENVMFSMKELNGVYSDEEVLEKIFNRKKIESHSKVNQKVMFLSPPQFEHAFEQDGEFQCLPHQNSAFELHLCMESLMDQNHNEMLENYGLSV